MADPPAEPAALDGGAAPADEAPQDAGAAAAPPPDAGPVALVHPALAKKPPPIKGKVTRIAEGQSKNFVGGIKITMGRPNHKHAVRGPALGMWTFTVERGTAKSEVPLSSSQEGFEAEVVEHGAFFVFRHVSYGSFDIVHVAGKAPKPWTDTQCMEQVKKAAAAAGLPEGSSSSMSTSNGLTYHYEGGWMGVCGNYSRRVWLMARPRDEE